MNRLSSFRNLLPGLLPGLLLGLLLQPGALAWAAAAMLAWVNDQTISSEEFLDRGRSVVPESGTLLSEAQKRKLLDDLISEELLHQQAVKGGYADHPMVRKTMVNMMLRELVYQEIKDEEVSVQEQRAWFQVHRAEFTLPEKRQVSLLQIGMGERSEAEARKLAEKLQRQLAKDPTQFAAVVQENSDAAHRRRGGDVGYVILGGRAPISAELVAAAFALEAGKVSEVIQTPEGFNVLLVTEIRPAEERTFEQVQGQVLRAVKSERTQARYAAYVERLKAEAKIREDANLLRAIQVPGSSGPPPAEEAEGEDAPAQLRPRR